jgi:hypothetical protein
VITDIVDEYFGSNLTSEPKYSTGKGSLAAGGRMECKGRARRNIMDNLHHRAACKENSLLVSVDLLHEYD